MSNYEVNVLVNGSRCKIYKHKNRLFVEAKYNSNYVVEIKNNALNRILAVSSIDSLNTISGKNEDLDASPGYVINGYNSLKIDGFRISDNEVSQFKFTSKKDGYAASKKDDSEKNVGVIGIRIFNEKIKPAPIIINHHYHSTWNTPHYPITYPSIIWGTTLNNNLTFNAFTQYSSATYNCCINNSSISDKVSNTIMSNYVQPKGFDMSTAFGEAKESKVVEVEFDRGVIIESFDIFYASRESLIKMEVPITNEKQINFPDPFKNSKYCIPPNHWNK